MFTGVAVEFTCPHAALPRAHDAPATVGLLADVSHSKRCERVRHRAFACIRRTGWVAGRRAE